MPITPTLNVDPVEMTNAWSAGLANPTNAQKLIAHYLKPRIAFNANPAGSQAAWQLGINKAMAANKYANGMANADLVAAANNMTQFGGANWANAGTSKKYKYSKKSAALAAAINAVRATVEAMPRGKGANNIARMVAWAQGMGAYYGKI
ncbi:MAG TPA: hypothetical protein VGH29_20745 [Candidatus Binataceae bacterium]|jgi:hypothetical protein